jgi:uncharacterized phage-associated protein
MSPIIITGTNVDLTKLRSLTLYIAERATAIGVTKLEKLLYLCDFEAIRALGTSITCDTYKNFQWGPVPKHFKVALNELLAGGQITSEEHEIGPGVKFNEIKPQAPCPNDAFSKDEWDVINGVLDKFGKVPGKTLVQMTHEQLPWKLTRRNEDIPDFLAHYVDHRKPTESEVQSLLTSGGYLDAMKGRLSVAA